MEKQNEEEKRRLDWHSGFEGGLRLSLRKYASSLHIEREHPLSEEPLWIDFLVIRKAAGVEIKNSLGRNFRKYNIIEYKNPNDELNIDVLWKTIGYASLFKSFGKTVNEIEISELTITIIRARKPVKLFKMLEMEGKKITSDDPGVYRIEGIVEVTISVIVIKELKDRELLALSIMRNNADEEDVKDFLKEAGRYTEPDDRRHADAVLQISAGVNTALYNRLRGDEIMCEALREIMAEDLKEAENIGEAKGEDKLLISQICKKLRKGKVIETIIDEVESEDDEKIQGMIDIAEKYAPDYETEKVFEEYIKTVKERVPECPTA